MSRLEWVNNVRYIIGAASGHGHTVTAEEMELHNQAGGAWSVINGKVYDLEPAQVSIHCCCCCCCCLHLVLFTVT